MYPSQVYWVNSKLQDIFVLFYMRKDSWLVSLELYISDFYWNIPCLLSCALRVVDQSI